MTKSRVGTEFSIWKNEPQSLVNLRFAFARHCLWVPVTEPLIRQLIKAATSVGANYCEADDAVSGKEFRQKIGTCKKNFGKRGIGSG